MQFSRQLIPIKADYLVKNTILNFDIFSLKDNKYNLLKRSHLPILEDFFREIEEKTGGHIFIRAEDLGNYNRYLEENFDVLINNRSITLKEKARILIEFGGIVAEQTYTNPGGIINFKRCRKLIEYIIDFINLAPEAFMYFEDKVPLEYELYTHCLNVAALSIQLAAETGADSRIYLVDLGLGALMHDIGMPMVPGDIRLKGGKLTDREYEIVKKHVNWGVSILEDVDFLPESAVIPVREHHERIDGKGYPFQKTGDEIHKFGKITSIAMVFDALITERPYRNAFKPFPALREMLYMEGAFDPSLLKIFIRIMGKPQN